MSLSSVSGGVVFVAWAANAAMAGPGDAQTGQAYTPRAHHGWRREAQILCKCRWEALHPVASTPDCLVSTPGSMLRPEHLNLVVHTHVAAVHAAAQLSTVLADLPPLAGSGVGLWVRHPSL